MHLASVMVGRAGIGADDRDAVLLEVRDRARSGERLAVGNESDHVILFDELLHGGPMTRWVEAVVDHGELDRVAVDTAAGVYVAHPGSNGRRPADERRAYGPRVDADVADLDRGLGA